MAHHPEINSVFNMLSNHTDGTLQVTKNGVNVTSNKTGMLGMRRNSDMLQWCKVCSRRLWQYWVLKVVVSNQFPV